MKFYSATIDKDRGMAITYARNTQQIRNWEILLDAKAKLAKHSMRTLSNSFSMNYPTQGFDPYVKGAVS